MLADWYRKMSGHVPALAWHPKALVWLIAVFWCDTLLKLTASPSAGNNDAIGSWSPFQYPIRRLIVRSRKLSKLRNLYLESSHRSERWQAPRQHCCRSADQISKRYDNLNQSGGFETLQDLTIKRLIGYWNGALVRKRDFLWCALTLTSDGLTSFL